MQDKQECTNKNHILRGGIYENNKFKNMTTNQLKEEYIACCFGAMIYGSKTEEKRKELVEEIERREKTT